MNPGLVLVISSLESKSHGHFTRKACNIRCVFSKDFSSICFESLFEFKDDRFDTQGNTLRLHILHFTDLNEANHHKNEIIRQTQSQSSGARALPEQQTGPHRHHNYGGWLFVQVQVERA